MPHRKARVTTFIPAISHMRPWPFPAEHAPRPRPSSASAQLSLRYCAGAGNGIDVGTLVRDVRLTTGSSTTAPATAPRWPPSTGTPPSRPSPVEAFPAPAVNDASSSYQPASPEASPSTSRHRHRARRPQQRPTGHRDPERIRKQAKGVVATAGTRNHVPRMRGWHSGRLHVRLRQSMVLRHRLKSASIAPAMNISLAGQESHRPFPALQGQEPLAVSPLWGRGNPDRQGRLLPVLHPGIPASNTR